VRFMCDYVWFISSSTLFFGVIDINSEIHHNIEELHLESF
jgi:hypothetical protein